MRPEKMEVRPRFRFDRIISSNSAILGSLDFGFALSRSPMNSLKPTKASLTFKSGEGKKKAIGKHTLCVLQHGHIFSVFMW